MPQLRRRLLEVQEIGDVTVVSFAQNKILDEPIILAMGEQLYSLVEDAGRKKLLLNFGKVEYLSGAALGKLLTLNKKVATVNGWLGLCNIDPTIYEVFENTELKNVFNIYDDENEALTSSPH